MRYTHSQILLHKSRDDYFKYTRIFTKLQIKSQILKSITYTRKIPQVWLWYVSELWFWIYFMISTQLYFQYRFPCFSFMVTLSYVDHRWVWVSLHRKISHFFFFWDGESISQNMERSTGNSKRILEMSYESPVVQGLFGKACPSFPAHISGFCCQLRMFCCVYCTRSQVKKKKNNNDLKREPVIITFGLSHK